MKRYNANDGVLTLQTALMEYMNADELKKLARLTKQPVPTRKAELAKHIQRYLEGSRLQTLWQSMNEINKAAVAEVVHSSDTSFHADRFRAKYGRNPDWGSLDPYKRDAHPTSLRFFFFGNGVMPADLKERLSAFVPRPVAAKVKSLDEIPSTYDRPYESWDSKTRKTKKGTEAIPLVSCRTEHSGQRELAAMLRLIDAGKVAVSDKTRKPTTAAIKTITTLLEGGDFYPRLPVENKYYDENTGPIRAFAWPMLLQAGKLAQLSGNRLRLTKAGREALSTPAADTISSLWSKWMASTLLDELSRIECVKGQDGKGKRGLTALAGRRETIRTALAECPQDRWIATKEFFRFLRATGNVFEVTRNAWDLYICSQQYGSLGYDDGERILEERYLLCLLHEYAATLGLIDVALIPPAGARRDYGGMWGTDELPYFSRYDGLMYFRINALGAYCLGVSASYTPAPVEEKPVLRVMPNLEIAAIGQELEQGDRLALDTYALQVSDLVWKLDTGTLLSAVDQGRPVTEIREYLEARSGDVLPDTVTRLLEDSANRSIRVYDRGAARLVECDEPALAALIANDSRTKKHCMRAGERHLVVPAASESAFKRNLRDIGYLLAADGPTKSKSRPSKSRRQTENVASLN